MSVSDRGPEVNFFSEYREPIIGLGYFVGLFLQGVAWQANAMGAVIVGDLPPTATMQPSEIDFRFAPNYGHSRGLG